jgi:hypothetical protein
MPHKSYIAHKVLIDIPGHAVKHAPANASPEQWAEAELERAAAYKEHITSLQLAEIARDLKEVRAKLQARNRR